LTYGCP